MPLVGQELSKENEVAVSGLLEEWRKGSCPEDRKRKNDKAPHIFKLTEFSLNIWVTQPWPQLQRKLTQVILPITSLLKVWSHQQ